MKHKYYIGLSANFHDSSMAIVDENGKIIFAQATERYLQNKHALSSEADHYFFIKSIFDGMDVKDYEIAVNWKYYNSWSRWTIAAQVVYVVRKYKKLLGWVGRSIRKENPEEYSGLVDFQVSSHYAALLSAGSSLRRYFTKEKKLSFKPIDYYDHHLTHAYHAYYTSPYEDATIVVLDGNGDEGKSYSVYVIKDKNIEIVFRNHSATSLGDYYGEITNMCGFEPLAGEQWKVMGMAPYGEIQNDLLEDLRNWIGVSDEKLLTKNSKKHLQIREKIRLGKYSNLSRQNIAHTGQFFYEEICSKLLNGVYKKWPNKNLIFTGGCALNSAFNGKIHQLTPFQNVYVPSAPADDGCAIGSALLSFKKHAPDKEIPNHQVNPFLGKIISENEIQMAVEYSGFYYEKLNFESLYQVIASELAAGKIVGWVQGASEFGPRALGNRSILAHPGLTDMKDLINSKVKFREEFRPFAPAILEEFADKYFDNYLPTPYMERVLTIKKEKRERLCAVNHVDNTGRLQTVSEDINNHFYNLIKEFYQLTQIPVLLNTSFNVMGKPIVDSVSDIMAVFTTSGLDIVVINEYVFYKNKP